MKQYRHELKFEITDSIAQILKQRLSLVMDIDTNYYYDDGSYLIRSLYFDDEYCNAYYEKINGVLDRKKYRIRIYNFCDDVIKLECKEKHNNYTFKRSIDINYPMYQKIINNDIFDIDIDKNLFGEFIYQMKYKGLKPSVIVDYRRIALTYPVSEVRVTFDYQISSGYNNYDLFDKNASNVNVLPTTNLIMEVKFNEILPDAIAMVLKSVSSIREAFSKYAMCKNLKE